MVNLKLLLRSLKYQFPGNLRLIKLPSFPDISANRLPGPDKEPKVMNSDEFSPDDLEIIKRNKWRIANIASKLMTDGFIDRAYPELNEMAKSHEDDLSRKEAAWELALYHSVRKTKEDAKGCMKFLSSSTDENADMSRTIQAAIIRSECHNLLGEKHKAAEILITAFEKCPSPELLLAYANLAGDLKTKVECFNKAFMMSGLGPGLKESYSLLPYFFRIRSLEVIPEGIHADVARPLVSIIIPTYNCSDTMGYVMDSVLSQTWKNIEVIVADDCSTDQTAGIVRGYLQKDKRVKFIRTEANSGLFVAMNKALQIAKGEFVTCQDQCEWAHPEKISIQAGHLVGNPDYTANISRRIKVNSNLEPLRAEHSGLFIQNNIRSLMFRRQRVMTSLGFWDSVRAGADEEMLFRLRRKFSDKRICYLETGPLAFLLEETSSFAKKRNPDVSPGALREYMESFKSFLAKNDSPSYEFPLKARRYPVPEPFWPVAEKKTNGRRHFDVLLASEFRLPGGTTTSNVEQIKAQRAAGLKTGLVHLKRYDINTSEPIRDKIRAEIDGDLVQMVVPGEKVSCDLLVVRHPPVLKDFQLFVPDIQVGHLLVVINTSPLREYSIQGERVYDFRICKENLVKYFGKEGIWCPIGPLVRDAVMQEDNILNIINLSDHNWHNIINDEEWFTGVPRCAGKVPVIGRHTRDQYVKWPERIEDLLRVYPDDDKFAVKVLGGAKTVEERLGRIPDNWEVYPFNSKNTREFLSEIDFCVYFHHKDLVEAFGRTPLEAMAAGVPVILPEHFRVLFREAAIYARPEEVKDIVYKYFLDKSLYQDQVEIARKFVKQNFSYSQHINRIRPFVKKLQG